MCLLELSFIVK